MPSSPPPSSEPKASSRTKLVFSFIGAFCTLIIFFSYYKIFKRQCSARRGTPLRTRSRRQLLNEANPDDPSLQFHSRGLDSYILHSLRSMQFRKKSEDESGENNVDCTICLGEFEEGELLRLLPNCAHAFHVSCIDTWFESHSNCPLCRSHITYDFTGQHNYSASLFTLLETPRREEALQERATSNQILLTEIRLHSAVRRT